MGEKITVGPINKGLRNDRTAFVIDNDSFPTLINAYQWRGRVKRKRGTSLLGRLKRFFNSTLLSYNTGSPTIALGGSGMVNIITGFGLPAASRLVPGTLSILDTISSITYTDPAMDGTLSPSGSVNYSTNIITILAAAGHAISANFNYFPILPVMGLRDLQLVSTQFPGTIAFDTVYSYNILRTFPYPIYDVSFYKNPPSGTYTDGSTPYVQKTNATPVTWNGQDYQQFWTVNYENAFWATNGITVPFSITNIGMQFQAPSIATRINATTFDFTIAGSPLVVGDFVFANEFTSVAAVTPPNSIFLNFQTGYVAVKTGDVYRVIFPNANIPADTYNPGILQYLTTRSDVTKDNIRFYDGDPTDGNPTTPTLTPGHGWVNFMPPLSRDNFSIGGLPAAKYYLVGARMIIPFKDRLLFLGVVVQTSGNGAPIYLQDTVVYSQNGTPYYTSSFATDPTLATTVFFPILVPDNQIATATAYWEDQTGFGGFASAAIAEPIVTCSSNEDVLIIGFSFSKTRFVYTGNDLIPFVFYLINSELGDASTFSAINLDKGVISRGTRGFTITSQTESQRFDLEIPDEVFEINLTVNGNERFTAIRDFINEWIYFTYPAISTADVTNRFPDQTLQYNYRDNSWAIFYESYTTYGSFRRQTGFTWATVGTVYATWRVWNDPWSAGTSTLEQQEVIGGNQQGFVIFRDEGTGEGASLTIANITGNTIINSPDHNLNDGDYIMISGVLGTLGTFLNNNVFSISTVTQNTFELDPAVSTGTYLGGGLITKFFVPFIQTKQFPVAWDMARKTRLGPQQYLFSTTADSEITLLIFLSQNSESAYNSNPIGPFPLVPELNTINNSLIYSAVLFTCPESTNLGLTPANVNLNMPTANQQEQIWHRMNTSLIGDTIQIGFTMSDAQMRELDVSGESFAITGASKAVQCVLTCIGEFETGQLIKITGVLGMVELNGNIYVVISSTPTTVTINVNSTGFTTYISGGLATPFAYINATAEIILHGFILDVNASQMLC